MRPTPRTFSDEPFIPPNAYEAVAIRAEDTKTDIKVASSSFFLKPNEFKPLPHNRVTDKALTLETRQQLRLNYV